MPGKSATGNGGKVGYYEHAWATKRDSTLSKKIFKCEPHRVPAKKLEPIVLEKVVEFITNRGFAERIFERVREFHAVDPKRKDVERMKAKIAAIARSTLYQKDSRSFRNPFQPRPSTNRWKGCNLLRTSRKRRWRVFKAAGPRVLNESWDLRASKSTSSWTKSTTERS